MPTNTNELPENPTAEEFSDLCEAFHYALMTARCPLPSFVHKYIKWLEKLIKARLQA